MEYVYVVTVKRNYQSVSAINEHKNESDLNLVNGSALTVSETETEPLESKKLTRLDRIKKRIRNFSKLDFSYKLVYVLSFVTIFAFVGCLLMRISYGFGWAIMSLGINILASPISVFSKDKKGGNIIIYFIVFSIMLLYETTFVDIVSPETINTLFEGYLCNVLTVLSFIIFLFNALLEGTE